MKPLRSQTRAKSWTTAILLLVLGYSFYLFRFGYGFGSSDQDEFIPYLLHLIDNSLFENDWFIQTQTGAFSVRTYFVYLLRAISLLLPVWLTVFLVYLASFISIVFALFKIADLLTYDRLVAVLSTAIICLLTPFWTLGGNDLIHSMLVPSMTAWAIGLWAFVLYLRRLYLPAAFTAGVATLFQALVGLQIFGLIGLLLTLDLFQSKNRSVSFQTILSAGLLYALVASTTLIPLILQQLATDFDAGSSEPSLFYIMALFRNPHHYLFYSFNKIRLLQFFLLLLIGYVSLLSIKAKNPTFNASFIFRMLTIVSGFCVVAFLGTEVYPTLTIAKFQLFKMTILIKILMVITTCTAVIRLLPSSFSYKLDQFVFDRPRWLAMFLLGFMISITLTQSSRLNQKIYPLNKPEDPAIQLAEWVRTNTNQAEVFAVPPSWSSFRSQTQRAIVVNHKAFPYRDHDIPIWFERISSFAPNYRPARSDRTLLPTLDQRYHSLSSDILELLSFEFDFDYVIRSAPFTEVASAFELVHEIDGWYVYKLSSQRMAAR